MAAQDPGRCRPGSRATRIAALPKDLVAYLRTLKGEHAVSKTGPAWTWTGPGTAELRKVGKFWVVIETPSEGADGRFITILTDRWK
ncbi:MAG: hypothetical protein IPL61_06710 [Myxococcales bacterium]|nr:hypothetical protein [Myxococcales bacterium]